MLHFTKNLMNLGSEKNKIFSCDINQINKYILDIVCKCVAP